MDRAIKLAAKKSKEGSIEEAKGIYRDILARFPRNKKAIEGLKPLLGQSASSSKNFKDPPQAQLQLLINLYNQGQLQQALDQSEELLEKYPESAFLFNIQGALFQGLRQFDLSLEAYSKALAIKPDFAEGFFGEAVLD